MKSDSVFIYDGLPMTLSHNTFHIIVIVYLLICPVGMAKTNESIPVLSIAPLQNNTGNEQYDALAEGFADMLVAAFSKQESVKVVERQRFKDLLKEHKLSLMGLDDPVNAVIVGKLLKADQIIVGGISKPKDVLVINVHAYEIKTARLVASEQIQLQPTELVPALYSLGNRLNNKLNLPLRPIDPNDIDKNPIASVHFIRGLGFYYVGKYDNAIVEFMKTQDLDSTSDKAGYWMALCFMETREYQHALIELEDVLKRFPDSSLRKEMLGKKKLCVDVLANKQNNLDRYPMDTGTL
jgi:TolB-like protein